MTETGTIAEMDRLVQVREARLERLMRPEASEARSFYWVEEAFSGFLEQEPEEISEAHLDPAAHLYIIDDLICYESLTPAQEQQVKARVFALLDTVKSRGAKATSESPMTLRDWGEFVNSIAIFVRTTAPLGVWSLDEVERMNEALLGLTDTSLPSEIRMSARLGLTHLLDAGLLNARVQREIVTYWLRDMQDLGDAAMGSWPFHVLRSLVVRRLLSPEEDEAFKAFLLQRLRSQNGRWVLAALDALCTNGLITARPDLFWEEWQQEVKPLLFRLMNTAESSVMKRAVAVAVVAMENAGAIPNDEMQMHRYYRSLVANGDVSLSEYAHLVRQRMRERLEMEEVGLHIRTLLSGLQARVKRFARGEYSIDEYDADDLSLEVERVVGKYIRDSYRSVFLPADLMAEVARTFHAIKLDTRLPYEVRASAAGVLWEMTKEKMLDWVVW